MKKILFALIGIIISLGLSTNVNAEVYDSYRNSTYHPNGALETETWNYCSLDYNEWYCSYETKYYNDNGMIVKIDWTWDDVITGEINRYLSYFENYKYINNKWVALTTRKLDYQNGKKYMYMIHTKNSKGDFIRQQYYSYNNGALKSGAYYNIYTYIKNKPLITHSYKYTNTGKIYISRKTSYYSNANKKQINYYILRNNKAKLSKVNYYSKNGRIAKINNYKYTSKGKMYISKKSNYHSNGKRKQINYYRLKNNKVKLYKINYYNKNGKLVKTKNYK